MVRQVYRFGKKIADCLWSVIGTCYRLSPSIWTGATLGLITAVANAEIPLGLPAVAGVKAPLSAAQVALGKEIFFDKRLSADGSVSCASCHMPEKAFTDGLPVAQGLHHQRGTRNTPSLWNVAFLTSQFWDGRRDSLELQATDPVFNPREHGLASAPQLLNILRGDARYRKGFHAAFGIAAEAITLTQVAQAVASFERTLLAGDSPFDRFFYQHDNTALSESAARGLSLFRGRARCASCHVIGANNALFTDQQFHSLGVGFQRIESQLAVSATRVANASADELDQLVFENADISELGRFIVTKQPRDIGKFKTPSLRNVALTAPYMHDGSLTTLAEAVDLEVYYRGAEASKPLILTPQEKADLVAFLSALTSPNALQFEAYVTNR